MMDQIIENQLIAALAKNFARPAYQRNALQESDAELIRLPQQPDQLLAVSIDTVAEEIAAGLYADPFTIGWMAVAANLSDLAAVGAQPLGLVLAMTLAQNSTEEYRRRLTEGVQAACSQAGTFVLGGDTDFGEQTSITGCAIGLVRESRVMTRVGCGVGDHLFASGPLGAGNAFALVRLSELPEKSLVKFQPPARLKEGSIIAQFASACIDSSDGAIAAVDQLMRLNKVGFLITCDWDNLLAATALQVCRKTGTPPWLMLAGYHGEFELIFTIPEPKLTSFMAATRQSKWQPTHWGRLTAEPEIKLAINERVVAIDSARIRNLFSLVGGDVQKYIRELVNLGITYDLNAATL